MDQQKKINAILTPKQQHILAAKCQEWEREDQATGVDFLYSEEGAKKLNLAKRQLNLLKLVKENYYSNRKGTYVILNEYYKDLPHKVIYYGKTTADNPVFKSAIYWQAMQFLDPIQKIQLRSELRDRLYVEPVLD